MRKFLLLLPRICAVVSGCQTKAPSANACDRWRKLTMRLETAVYVTVNDRELANGVAAHNAHGARLRCWT